MILVFPQATTAFNALFEEMISSSDATSFLESSFASYNMQQISKVVLILLENNLVEGFLRDYLSHSELIKEFEILVLKKETSGSICTTLMAIHKLQDQKVIISALDQIIIGGKIDIEILEDSNDFDVIVPTYESDNPSLCYVLRDDKGKAIQLFEKKAVSPEAILGVYIFRNFSMFSDNCFELLVKYKGFKNRIFYTSDVINNFISKDLKLDFPFLKSQYIKVRDLRDFRNIKKAL